MKHLTKSITYLTGCAVFMLSLFSFVSAQSLDTSNVITGLDTPWEILWGPDDEIWFTERKGVIGKVDPATGDSTLIADFTAKVEEVSEAGLMGMVVHPDFDDTPHVFIAYNYRGTGNNIFVKVERYYYQNEKLDSATTIIDGIQGAQIHDGCRLLITPDYKLLITTGDAASSSLAQQNSSLNGKMLRLNLDGSIPLDNPYQGNPLWTKGHRNAQGIVMHDGVVYISEHGPTTDDEVNMIMKGRNYGWPQVHGFCNLSTEMQFCQDSNVVEPMMAWTPTLAVAGIDFYNKSRINAFSNSILMTTLKASKLVRLELNSAGDSIISTTDYFEDDFGRLRDVCVSPDGKVYIATSNRDGRGSPISVDDRIIEIDDQTVGVKENGSTSFKIYPNPAEDVLSISFKTDVSGIITMFDSNGRAVYHHELTNQRNLQMDVDSYSSGIYMLQLKTADFVKNTRVFIQHP